MTRIFAVCESEMGCPLFKKGARLEFTPPMVSGVDGGPVCSAAVEALQKPVLRIVAGAPPASHARTFCGGCSGGKAWWTPEAPQRDTETLASVAATQTILKHVSRMKLFTGIHIAKLMRLSRFMKETEIAPHQQVIVRGRPGEAFYIVTEGEFEVVQHDEHQVESTLAVLPVGECFGEMSLITGEPASATVRARGTAKVIAVSKENFHNMLAAAPEIAITLARILANRLARTGRFVIDELKKGMMGRLELISPAELIQAMNVNNQTGMLIVQNADRTLSIYLHDGQVAEVSGGEKKGEEAFFEFLSWARGQFRFEPVRKDGANRQIQQDTMGLLLEGMRRVDEIKQTGVWKKDAPPA